MYFLCGFGLIVRIPLRWLSEFDGSLDPRIPYINTTYGIKHVNKRVCVVLMLSPIPEILQPAQSSQNAGRGSHGSPKVTGERAKKQKPRGARLLGYSSPAVRAAKAAPRAVFTRLSIYMNISASAKSLGSIFMILLISSFMASCSLTRRAVVSARFAAVT